MSRAPLFLLIEGQSAHHDDGRLIGASRQVTAVVGFDVFAALGAYVILLDRRRDRRRFDEAQVAGARPHAKAPRRRFGE